MEALEQRAFATQSINEQQANLDDARTWLAEILDGPMRSEFSYEFNGEDLVARDGRLLGEVFSKSIYSTTENAKWDSRLNFEVRRVNQEWDEYEEMVDMSKGNGANTMVVVSDFPEEMKSSEESLGGYDIDRQTAMLRVITRDNWGNLKVVSQSLDRSDRQSLEAIYRFLGYVPEPGELLGQRISLEMDENFHPELDKTLTRVYDTELASKLGGNWSAGRSPGEDINTLDFASQQSDLIKSYLNSPMDEKARYNLSAAITKRYELRNKSDYDRGLGRMFYMTPELEMQYQGRIAALAGKKFNGCGGTLKMELEDQLSSLGYGAGNDKDDDSSGEMKCVNCPECKTFHDKVRKVSGKPVCDNPECKLSDKKPDHKEQPKKEENRAFFLQNYFSKNKKLSAKTNQSILNEA